jgi:exodeoxyribonuclease VII small subunit
VPTKPTPIQQIGGLPMPDSPCDALTFEEALAELERVVRELEDGKIGLEESLARYEHGVALLKRCYGQLRQVEQKIVELTGVAADGTPLTKPFDHSASVDAKDPKRR